VVWEDGGGNSASYPMLDFSHAVFPKERREKIVRLQLMGV